MNRRRRSRLQRFLTEEPEIPEFAPNGPRLDVVIIDEFEPTNRPLAPLATLTPTDIFELGLSEDELEAWHIERFPDWGSC